ncbi:MAG: DUF418 domain-containing protein [Hyphomicrobium sp.]
MPDATTSAERIEILDGLRGLALFGILLANILYWSGWTFMTDGQRLSLAGSEAAAWQYRFHHLLIDGKFYTIFSLLFGAGFALQIARLASRGADGVRIYRRRVLVLLGMGLIHSWLIWDGDILTLYALLGLLLPVFRDCRERTLLLLAVVLIFAVPAVGIGVFSLLGWEPQEVFYDVGVAMGQAMGANTEPDQAIAWLSRPDFMGWFSWTFSGNPFSWGLRLETWRVPKVLGIMLVGMVVGRRLANGTLLEDPRLLKWIVVLGLAVGLPPTIVYAATPGLGQAHWSSVFGTVPLALAYSAGFVLLWRWAHPVLRHLAPVGRMALTNYLMHSVIGALLFYGIGFGLVGRLQPVGIYAVAATIFALQIVISRWWLSRHQQGPMERLWRLLTYA